MLGLAEFRGLAPAAVARLPAVAYFHENQLTYPDRFCGERDRHYGFTNLTTAMSAEQVWFNSAFHRDEFLAAADELLRRMPDFRERQVIGTIRAKSRVMAPGVHPVGIAANRSPGPLRIVWAARWEHDKDPATFFRALGLLRDRGVEFQVSVLGESFRNVPVEFREAHAWLGRRILHWGFLPSRDAYHAALRAADVFVSTARHEFFGLAAVEAITAGAYPLLPRRLSYPELLGLDAVPRRACHFYDGNAESLAERLAELADLIAADPRGLTVAEGLQRSMLRYGWPRQAQLLDEGLEQFVIAGGGCSV
jgi:glycosyltransferase involved in cell wall biosynthesis